MQIKDIIKNIKWIKIDNKILHNIKGISGNLRFNKLFELSKKFEEDVHTWNEAQHIKNKELIIIIILSLSSKTFFNSKGLKIRKIKVYNTPKYTKIG